jgi:outer membrane protein TolC
VRLAKTPSAFWSCLIFSLIAAAMPALTAKASLAVASPAEARALSLSEVVRIGLANSDEIKSAEASRKGAKALYRQYVGEIFPRVDWVTNAVREKDGVLFAGLNPNQPVNRVEREIYSSSLVWRQPILAGGALRAGLKLGDAAEDTAEHNLFRVKQERVFQIVSRVYDLAEQESLKSAIEGNLQSLKKHLELLKRYERIGRSRKMDRLQAAANSELAEVDLETAHLQAENLRAQLTELLQESLSSLRWDEAKDFERSLQSEELLWTLASAEEQALQRSPDIQLQAALLKTTRAQNDLELSRELPTLTLQGEYGFASADRDELFSDLSKRSRIGIVLTVPLLSGLTSLSMRRVHKEEIFQGERQLAVLQRDLRARLKDQWLRLQREKRLLQISQSAARQTAEALREGNQAFAKGTVSSQDLLSVQRSQFEAQTRYISRKFLFLRSLLTFRRETGQDLEGLYGGNAPRTAGASR